MELLTDLDMYLMFEQGTHGGLVQVVYCLPKVNNKCMGRRFNSHKPSISIIYVDANNLYGWTMSQLLLTGKFKWIKDVHSFTSKKISDLVMHCRKEYLL